MKHSYCCFLKKVLLAKCENYDRYILELKNTDGQVTNLNRFLIILAINLLDTLANPIKRDLIDSIYRDYTETSIYLVYSDEQNVSSDIICNSFASAIIEGTEKHTRTTTIKVYLGNCKWDSRTSRDH